MITSNAPSITWHRTRENILAANADAWSYLALPTQDGAYRIAIAAELAAPPQDWTADDFYRTNLFAPDESAARDRIELLERLHRDLKSPKPIELDPGITTPWEAISRKATTFSEGFVHHATDGIFGFHLDPEVNALIYPGYRRDDGWYDEHIGWASVASTFPTLLPTQFLAADRALRHLSPETHEYLNGPTPLPNESEIIWGRARGDVLAATATGWSFLALPTQDGAYRIAIAVEQGALPGHWDTGIFFNTSLFAPNEAAVRDRIELLARHWQERGGVDLDPGAPTPWGEAQHSTLIADGIVRHHTASHGGFRLQPALNDLVHPAYRNQDGCYEEDVEWYKVAVTFPTLFPFEYDKADEVLRDYVPDAHQQVNGVMLTPDLEAVASADRSRDDNPGTPPSPRSPAQELAAMQRMNFPEYAQINHGYSIEWRGANQDRAVLTKGDEQLRAVRDADGSWSYDSYKAQDRGDIVDFELNRGAKNAADARLIIRPFLERVEREQGRLDISADLERERDIGLER